MRSLVRLFWGTTATLLILLAVMVQLGRSGSFLVSDYRQDLADYWSQKLQLQVTIGGLSMQWQSLRPELLATDVSVQTLGGANIAEFKSTRVELLLLPSLLRLQPVVSELQIKGVQLAFQQSEDGRWSLQGLPRGASKTDDIELDSNVSANPFNTFLFGRDVQLLDASLEFNFRNKQQVSLQVPEIRLENSRDFHRLSMRMDIENRKDMVTLVVEAEGDPRDTSNFISRGYLRVLQLPTDRLISAASKKWLQENQLDLAPGGDIDLELWLNGGDSGFEWSGRIDGRNLPSLNTQMPVFKTLSSNVKGYWHRTGDWQLTLQDAVIDWTELLSFDLQLGSSGNSAPLNVAIDRVSLAPLNRLVKSYLPSDGRLAKSLAVLNPSGDLRRVNLTVPMEAPKEFKLSANLDQVAVDALGGAPALTKVDGYLFADKAGGVIELDSRKGFSMQYNIYAEAMEYDSAYGAVAWHLRPDDNAIYVNSSQLSLRGEDGEAEGFLSLSLPWVPHSRKSEMILQIGLRDSQVKYHSKYVPEVVPPSLHKWLDDSLTEGDINWAGFIYRGALIPTGPADHTVQVALDINGASLEYHQRWPQLQGIDGLLVVDDIDVNVAVARAQLYDSNLTATDIKVGANPHGSGLLLDVNSQLQGPAADGLRVLRESMLRDTLGDSFDEWALGGTMEASLDLSIPLSSEQPGARQRVAINLIDADLTMNALDLNFEKLSGQLLFDERRGLSAKKLQGQFFQQPFSAEIASNLKKHTTKITAKGAAESSDLANWSKRPELLFVDGVLPFNIDLSLFHGVTTDTLNNPVIAQLQIDSNLLGASVDLPVPFKKDKTTQKPLQVAIEISQERTDYTINYADQVEFKLQQTKIDGQLERMALGLYGSAEFSKARTFSITGQLPYFDFGPWRNTFERYQSLSESFTAKDKQTMAAREKSIDSVEASLETSAESVVAEVNSASVLDSTPAPLVVLFDTRLDHFEMGGFELHNLLAKGEYRDQRWLLNLDNPTIKGQLLAYDDLRPLQIDLAYLHLANSSDSPEVAAKVEVSDANLVSELSDVNTADKQADIAVNDVLVGIDPQDLPAMDFSVDDFSVGAEDYGLWRFLMRPNDNGIALNSIVAEVKGVEIKGIGKDAGASLIWHGIGADSYTEFKGVLASADLKRTLSEFKQAGLIESKEAAFVADLGWRGSPAAIGLNQLRGRIDLDIGKGVFPRTGNAGSSPALRLLGLLNFDSLLRRLKLDFSDMYKDGMAFDSIKGELQFAEGTLYLQEPLKVRTPSSRLQLAGVIDLHNESLDATLVAALPVSSPLALLAALTAGLPVAAGIYLAGKVFEEQVDKLTSVSYNINGSWDDPSMKFNRIFDAKAAKRSGDEAREQEQAAPH